MIEYARMYFLLTHFMNHGIYRSTGKFIDKYSVIMVCVTTDLLVKFIAQKKGFVIEVNLDIHAVRLLAASYKVRTKTNRFGNLLLLFTFVT